MNEQELRDLLRKAMENDIKPLITEACDSVTKSMEAIFTKGFDLGLAVGLRMQARQDGKA